MRLTNDEIKVLIECNNMKFLEHLMDQGEDVDLARFGYTTESVRFNYVQLENN